MSSSSEFITGDELDRIATDCRRHLDEHPVAYFVIGRIARDLETEYGEQGIPVSRVEKVAPLSPLIRAALAAPESMDRLSELILAYKDLY